jgi:hypothetical protein
MRLRVLTLYGLVMLAVLAVLAACGGTNDTVETDNPAASSMTGPEPDVATAAPTASPPPAGPALGEEQVVAEAGYAFRPLTGWTVDVQGGVAGMRPPDADPEAGPSIAITVGNLEQLNIEDISSRSLETSQDFFDAVRAGIQRETQGITFEEAQPMTIDGHDAYAASFRSMGFANLETEVAGQMSAALIEGTRGFVMFGIATPPDQWQHTAAFEAVRDSVRILPAPTPTPTPTD